MQQFHRTKDHSRRPVDKEEKGRSAQEQRDEQGERKESLCWEWGPVKGRWEAEEQGEGSGRQMR